MTQMGGPSPAWSSVLLTNATNEVARRLRGRRPAVVGLAVALIAGGVPVLAIQAMGWPPTVGIVELLAVGFPAAMVATFLVTRRNVQESREAWGAIGWARSGLAQAARADPGSDLRARASAVSKVLERALGGALIGDQVTDAFRSTTDGAADPTVRAEIRALVAMAEARLAIGQGDQWRQALEGHPKNSKIICPLGREPARYGAAGRTSSAPTSFSVSSWSQQASLRRAPTTVRPSTVVTYTDPAAVLVHQAGSTQWAPFRPTRLRPTYSGPHSRRRVRQCRSRSRSRQQVVPSTPTTCRSFGRRPTVGIS